MGPKVTSHVSLAIFIALCCISAFHFAHAKDDISKRSENNLLSDSALKSSNSSTATEEPAVEFEDTKVDSEKSEDTKSVESNEANGNMTKTGNETDTGVGNGNKGVDGEGGDNEGKLKVYWNKLSSVLSENKAAVQNMIFVLIGLTSLVVLFFIIRTMRLRQKKSKSRKYGVLTNGMEMDHLESDLSDDEDTTVFEINHRR